MLCGAVSSGYRSDTYGDRPGGSMQFAFRRASMQGFLFFDHVDRFPEAFGDLSAALTEGAVVVPETVTSGLDGAPDALAGLFRGDSLGKALVHLPE